MTLVLTVVRCPDDVTPETRRLSGGELRIGRDQARADWVLRDPAQTLSRQHCIVRFDGTQWQVSDSSTNGTFLNRDPAPVGQSTKTLRSGDRLRLGAYELEVRIEAAAAANPFGVYSPFEAESSRVEGRSRDPFAAPPRRDDDMFGTGSMAPGDELFANPDPHPPQGPPPAQRDHTPSFTDAMQPQHARAQLNNDWEKEFEFLQPAQDPVQQPIQQSGLQPIQQESQQPGAGPFREPGDASAPKPAGRINPPDEAGLLDAFMNGAGLGDLRPTDPLTAMRDAGAAFRAFVSGLREALMVRAEIKSAMRIDQTFIRAKGNNPLKFSAGDDDALAALLGTGRRTDMTPQAAVAEALRDLRHHEQATMPAVQSALRALLDRLDPAKFRAAGEPGGFLPAQKRAKSFEAYEAEYMKLRAALADDFDAVFGRRFAEAYEAMVADLQRAEGKR